MKPRSKPRYRPATKAPRPAKGLVLKPKSAARGWMELLGRWVVLYTALPLALLWLGNLVLNPYRVYFDARPSSVTLDESSVALDSTNGFDLSRFAVGEHLLRYADPQGQRKAVRLHVRLDGENGGLAISDHKLSGLPKAEFVGQP